MAKKTKKQATPELETPQLPGPEVQARAKEGDAFAAKALTFVEKARISDATRYKAAAAILAEIKAKANEMDEQRKGATSLLRKVIAMIDGWFSPALASLETSEKILKQRIVEYVEESAKTQLQAQAKASEAFRADDPVAMQKALTVFAENDLPKVPGLTLSTRWDYEVIDASAVPAEYRCVDEKKIGVIARGSGGTIAIPGVRIFPRMVVSSRSAT